MPSVKKFPERFTAAFVLYAAGSMALSALLFPSCRKGDIVPQDTFRMNMETEPPSLDWALATDHNSILVLVSVMEGLTQFDNEMHPGPALAESWSVSDDGMTYTFHIRPGVMWSDGVPLTAKHFVDGWRRILDPATAAEYAYFLYDVENAEDYNQGVLKDFSKVGVSAPDDHTLVVRLNKPIVFFPAIVTFMATYPARLDVIKRWGDTWTEPGHIVTLGPYLLKSWRHEYKIELVRNESYYGDRPAVEKIVMYMVDEGNSALDLYESDALDYVSVPTYAIPFFKDRPDYRSMPYLSGYYYGFNVKKPPFDDARVRQAFAMAVDREILPKILHGSVFPATSWIPPGLLGHNPDIGIKFDPKRAKELLKEAGYESPSKLPPITLSYNNDSNNVNKLVAENIKEQWRANLGVNVKLDDMEWKVYLQRLKGNPPQVYRLGWTADYPDPENFMGMFLGNSGNNHTQWANPEFDKLVKMAAAEPDTSLRKEYYDRAQRIFLEQDCAIIPLFFSSLNRLVSPRVEGLDLNIMDFLLLKNIRLKPLTGAAAK